MIDLQTLAQWRTHAPLMVERDYLCSQAVERIFRDGKQPPATPVISATAA